jgi:hypothetical protein
VLVFCRIVLCWVRGRCLSSVRWRCLRRKVHAEFDEVYLVLFSVCWERPFSRLGALDAPASLVSGSVCGSADDVPCCGGFAGDVDAAEMLFVRCHEALIRCVVVRMALPPLGAGALSSQPL